MVGEHLREELTAMREEDLRVSEELVVSGELSGTYVPRMEEVHKRTDLPQGRRQEMEQDYYWWQTWLASKGWPRNHL